MRRSPPIAGIARDDRAAAPFAVIAVVLLLGAGISYAYLTHLQATRDRMEGGEPWADEAIRALDAEVALLEAAVRSSLEGVLEGTDPRSSDRLVSDLAVEAQASFATWADGSYPRQVDGATITLTYPRLSLGALYGNVTTGNVLGQQVPQRLPVGLEAVGVADIEVTLARGAFARREAVARADVLAPEVLAAHLQDVLEYQLADEGLVHAVCADALRARLFTDPDGVPSEEEARRLVLGAVGMVQRSLFRVDTQAPWVYVDDDGQPFVDVLVGPDVLDIIYPGQVWVDLPPRETITVTHPRTGRTVEARLVPAIDWYTVPETDLRISKLCGAEAHGGARLARFDAAGSFGHSVDVWIDGAFAGRVERDMVFRDHVVAWAGGPEHYDEGVKYGQAQVEDWRLFNKTMGTVCPPPRPVTLVVPPSFGAEVEVFLDGVPLGVYRPGDSNLRNVLAGPHHVTVLSSAGPSDIAYSTTHQVPYEGEVPPIEPVPEEVETLQSGMDFWFSIMAAFHRSDAGPLAHLEWIAALSGYPVLPAHVSSSPGDNLEEVAFWVEGLENHLEFQGGSWDDKGVSDPIRALEQAKQVVSLAKLTHKLLLKLPQKALESGRLLLTLTSSEGRTDFVAWSRTGEKASELLKGTSTKDGCSVTFTALGGTIVAKVDSAMTALSVIGQSLSIVFDCIEVYEAAKAGDWDTAAWALLDLGFDIARLTLSLLSLFGKVGIPVLSALGKAVASVIGAAITVVATFLDAYKEAGDVMGAFDLLLHPNTFSDALRTAGFVSALASLITTAVVTAALPTLTGATLGGAFLFATALATGVGLVVFAVVLLVWVAFNRDVISGWLSGTAKDEEVESVRQEVQAALASTMELRARLNAVDVPAQVAEGRSERALGLALRHLRSTSGDAAMVDALGRADIYHLDGGSAQGRLARAVCELKFWTEVLWREADDFIDNDRGTSGGEDSEGFSDYKDSLGAKDHDFDADLKVGRDGSGRVVLQQSSGGIGLFLASLNTTNVAGMKVELDIEGKVYKDGLEEWVKAVGAISDQLGEASRALARASRESAFVSSTGSQTSYSRDRGLATVVLPEGTERCLVEVESPDGGVMVAGSLMEGPQRFELEGSAMLAVSGTHARSRIVDWTGEQRDAWMVMGTACNVHRWHELMFGEAKLDHSWQ